MKQQSGANQSQNKKRLKKIAKSKARRAELNKKHKKNAVFIAKEVEILRKKREREFFQALEQRKRLKKLLQDSSPRDDAIEKEAESDACPEIIEKVDEEVAECSLPTKIEEQYDAPTVSYEEIITETEKESEDADNDDESSTSSHQSIDEVAPLNDGNVVINLQDEDLSSGVVAFKSTNQLFKFHGHTKLIILKGVCFLNGFKMGPGDTHVAYSPVTHPAMVLRISDNDASSIPINHGFDLSGLPEEHENYCALVVFQSLEHDDKPRHLPGYTGIYNTNSVHGSTRRQLCSTCWQCDTERCFVEYDFYKQAAALLLAYEPPHIENHFEPSPTYPVAVAVGGKNVGKSTLNRYLVNRLLERHSHVYYFECDVGQTEFTPSGLLCIHKIENTAPLLGPPFSHQLIPKYCCYYGNRSPEGSPSRYFECIEFLYNTLRRELDDALDAPLIINTMGWLRGLGSLLLTDIIRLVSPTHILQFETIKPSLNHCRITNYYMNHSRGWIHKTSQKIRPFKLVLITTEVLHRALGRYQASDYRALSLLSYIQKMIKRCQSQQSLEPGNNFLLDLQSINPYCVRLSHIALCNAQDKVSKHKFAMALFNATPVALCVAPQHVANELKNISGETCIPSPPVCSCIGLGIVRGVDVDHNVAYVISDLSPSEIEKVNCIVRGDLSLSEAFQVQKGKSKRKQNAPYVTHNFPYETLGSNSFRSYRRYFHMKPQAQVATDTKDEESDG